MTRSRDCTEQPTSTTTTPAMLRVSILTTTPIRTAWEDGHGRCLDFIQTPHFICSLYSSDQVRHLSNLRQPMWGSPRTMVINEIKGMKTSKWSCITYKILSPSNYSNTLVQGSQVYRFYSVKKYILCISIQRTN